MITRRQIVRSSAGSLLFGSFAGHLARAAEPVASATGDGLLQLPGKQPLIRRSFRPPNLETPLAQLRHAFTPNEAFFVRYHLAHIPQVDSRSWRLRVGGASAKGSIELSFNELKRGFQRISIAAINQCSGNRRGLFMPRAAGVQWGYGAMGNAQWTGVRLRDVLHSVGVKADALEVVCDGADTGVLPATPDYIKSLPIERALDETTLLAFEMNGEPLPHWNGAPVRLVVPGWTATYWIKHLTEIRIEPKAFDGFWMRSAYRLPLGAFSSERFVSQENAETTPITRILVNSLMTSHLPGAQLKRNEAAEISGWAWDGGSGIAEVQTSTDSGRTWRQATLGKDFGRFAWRGFTATIDTSKAGPMTVAVRATARDGSRQAGTLTPNPSGYHHNLIQVLPMVVV